MENGNQAMEGMGEENKSVSLKTCNRCKESLPLSDFRIRPGGKPYNPCLQCKRAYDKARHVEKSKSLQWRISQSERNKKYYHEKKLCL